MAVKFKNIETQEGKRFRKALEEIDKLAVFVGFQAGEVTSDKGVDVANYAAFNELGTTTGIPSRPFIRNSVDGNMERIQAFQREMIGQLLDGESPEKILRQIGAFQKGLIQEEITDGHFEANKESTIRRKHSDHPLIDTGLMRQSVNYQIGEKEDFE